MLRRLNGPQRWIVATAVLLAFANALHWWSPQWYDADVGSLVLGILFMLLFLTIASVLFDVFWPMNGHSKRR
jgi:uncharacterized protein (DUF2062 family)